MPSAVANAYCNNNAFQPGTPRDTGCTNCNAFVGAGANHSYSVIWGGNCANQTNLFVLNGSGAVEHYRPEFTYMGFRFAQLWGLPEGVEPTTETLVQHFVHSDVPEVGTVHLPATTASPNGTADILNRVQSATVYAQRSNLMSIPTDCPQRERRGWMGDAHVSQSNSGGPSRLFSCAVLTCRDMRGLCVDELERGAPQPRHARKHLESRRGPTSIWILILNPQLCWHIHHPSKQMPCLQQAFYTNFLNLIRDDQLMGCETKQGEGGQSCPNAVLSAGSIADVTPFTTGPYGAFPGSVVWQAAYPVITYNTWKAYGDLQLIGHHWDGLVALSDYWSRQPCAQSAQNLCGGLGDWVDPSWPIRTTDAQVRPDVLLCRCCCCCGYLSI